MMHSPSRTLATQIALGAAFGTALAWKTWRVRQHEETSREDARARVRDRGEQPAWSDGPAAPRRGRHMDSSPRFIPVPALLMLLLGTGAVVVVVVAFVIAIARTHDRANSQAHVVPSVAPAETPLPARTPTLAEQLQDVKRQRDLASVATALDAYATFFGAYPSTGGEMQTLCAQPTDAGCTLSRYSKDLPLSDGTQPYRYASDGRTYTLLARVATPPAVSNCPAGLPDTLRDTPVYCRNGALATR
jgi:hypothetical protein